MRYKLSEIHIHKRAFITGGGSGLGRALSVALAADGWALGITDIKEEGLYESAKLIELAGGRAYAYHFNAADKNDYKKAFDDFISKTGGLDILINNAGVGDSGLFGDYDLEHWDWITGVNLMASVYGSHFATPVMKKQGSGHIISIASAAGFANMPNMSMYNVTKAAVISLMETLYAELYGHGVQVSVVCPAFFRSNVMQYRRGDAGTGVMANEIVRRAKYSADDMSGTILDQAGKNVFYILPGYQAGLVFHLKRLFPKLTLRYKARRFSSDKEHKWLIKALEI
jgi:NAD(P)-dependent dehydrogenase (short-subunit alcohol dehydrogenase family)